MLSVGGCALCLMRVPACQDALDRVWHRVVEKATGFKNMDEMRAAWQAEKAEQAAGAEA